MKRLFMDMNFWALLAIFGSIVMIIVPLMGYVGALSEAKRVADGLRAVEFALRQLFYSKSEGIGDAGSVTISVLESEYYLKKGYEKDFGIYWTDRDVDDGRVSAVIFYKGQVDPVKLHNRLKRVVWFDPRAKKVYKDYRKGRNAALVVEVKLF